jgi:hypothetical protein
MIKAQNYIADPAHLDDLLTIALKEFPKNDPAVMRRVIEDATPAWKPAVLPDMIAKNAKLLQVTGQLKGVPPAYKDVVEASLASIWKQYRH